MYNKGEISLVYSIDNNRKCLNFKNNFKDENIEVESFQENNLGFMNYKVYVKAIQKISIQKLAINVYFEYDKDSKIFVNGYQSWTDSKEFFIDEKISGISKIAKLFMNKYNFDRYGDYMFYNYSGKKGIFHGYTYSYVRKDRTIFLFGSLSEDCGFTIFEHDTKNNVLKVKKEIEGLGLTNECCVFNLFFSKGEENTVFDNYFKTMNVNSPKCKPMTGWTSWYNYYQDINENKILDCLNSFYNNKIKIDIFQIDDGYQAAVGDWLDIDKTKFPKGMKHIADNIKSKGYKAGIWLAPFVCETNSRIFREKKEWILKDSYGNYVVGGSNWSKFYALDFYNKEVQDYLRHVFNVVLDEWGYDMVKLDFLYAVCIIPQKGKTRGSIMCEAMDFLRKCVGEKLILGCGVPLGPAFGKVDYCRIGCDIDLGWEEKYYMKLIHRERVSTPNTLENTIGRRHLNGRAFLNDPDVFLLRDNNINLTDIQKKTVFIVNYIFGSVIFTSDNIREYNDEKLNLYKNIEDFKLKEIKSVKRNKNGLYEVMFNDNRENCFALININNKGTYYKNNIGKLIESTFGNKNTEKYDVNGNIPIEAYESKVFKIE